ncbi:hypothetical protein PV735_11290 [Streptomyces turgidiscabies]|uniref:DUF2637 domain-containing protein n=1 Tax=Streptomyces turgidiscabies (strain Car8) TaxID=698760 RepID=L7ESC8_STRT8|nr:hypothetical protein [Streptomyces turgidiscabies]ELP61799.1 hypothetical protein STRTUCAR8_06436 [Streptomyces turgidiscabies Car8]MDX3493268.1 hypothetical protein [Streptomyces turgidiscabies]GAQ70568.1 hypothetical protein T45_02304 [Streptomyces turgidiscabies]
MKRDPLLWAALVAVLVVLASAEYQLAVACGFGTYVAAGVPAALDVYALAALRARRDVLAVVVVLIAVNAASHLVEVGLLPVNVQLVVSVSAIAPLVLWRVHRLSEAAPEPSEAVTALSPEPSSAPAEPVAELPEPAPELRVEPAEPITVERVPEPVDAQPSGPVLGPWTPVAELMGGTSGTAFDLRLPNGYRAAGPLGGTMPEPTPEPVPPVVPLTGTDSGTGAEDIEATDSQNTTFEARVALVRTWLITEPDLTGTEIGTKFRVSDGYGRRLLRTARGDT